MRFVVEDRLIDKWLKKKEQYKNNTKYVNSLAKCYFCLEYYKNNKKNRLKSQCYDNNRYRDDFREKKSDYYFNKRYARIQWCIAGYVKNIFGLFSSDFFVTFIPYNVGFAYDR